MEIKSDGNPKDELSSILSIPFSGDHLVLDIYNILHISKNKYRRGRGYYIEGIHSHTYYELHVIIEGANQYHFDKQAITVKAREFLLIPPGITHMVTSNMKEVSKYALAFMVHTTEDSTVQEHELVSHLPKKTFCKGSSNDALINYFQIALQERSRAQWGYLKMMRMLCGMILYELIRLMDNYDLATGQMSQKFKQDERFAFAKHFIADNIAFPINSKDVASAVHISVRQLDRIFLKESGSTISHFMETYRYNFAKQMLSSRNDSIMSIGMELGFPNQYSFSRFFKRMDGQSPSEYRVENDPDHAHQLEHIESENE